MRKPNLIRIELEDRGLAFAALVWLGNWQCDSWHWVWQTTAYSASAIAAAKKTRHAYKTRHAPRFPKWAERQLGKVLNSVEGRRRFSQ